MNAAESLIVQFLNSLFCQTLLFLHTYAAEFLGMNAKSKGKHNPYWVLLKGKHHLPLAVFKFACSDRICILKFDSCNVNFRPVWLLRMTQIIKDRCFGQVALKHFYWWSIGTPSRIQIKISCVIFPATKALRCFFSAYKQKQYAQSPQHSLKNNK